MKEMTDQELTDRISHVFDNLEDPTAEHGWRELRKKYPLPEKKPALLWWGAAAAVLVILCGLWFIVPDANEADQTISDKKPKTGINSEQVSINNNRSEKTQSRIDNNSVSTPFQNSDRPVNSSASKSVSNYSGVNLAAKQPPLTQDQRSISPVDSPAEPDPINIPDPVTPQILTAESSPVKNLVLSLAKSATTGENTGIARDSTIDAVARMLALEPQSLSADNHAHRVEETRYISRRISTKNHSFSVYAGSYFNYSLGSETKLNFGAGFTSDIRLASNLKLSTGLALAKNSLTYNNGVPSSSNARLTYDVLPSFGLNHGGLVNNNLTTVTKYDASLLALDIPLNLKYMIIPEDNKLYLVAGLSSGTYLSETYSLNYRNYSPAGKYLNQGQGVEVKNQLQTFDLARTLNISFGYSANLGKSQNITIEPFLKYPLGGLGSEELRFGSTGVNLKLNFSKFKR